MPRLSKVQLRKIRNSVRSRSILSCSLSFTDMPSQAEALLLSQLNLYSLRHVPTYRHWTAANFLMEISPFISVRMCVVLVQKTPWLTSTWIRFERHRDSQRRPSILSTTGISAHDCLAFWAEGCRQCLPAGYSPALKIMSIISSYHSISTTRRFRLTRFTCGWSLNYWTSSLPGHLEPIKQVCTTGAGRRPY